jgi:hypothetical protein
LMKYRLFFERRAPRGAQKIIWFHFNEKRCIDRSEDWDQSALVRTQS